jgi:transcriptional regulator with XRE-family HTH domain
MDDGVSRDQTLVTGTETSSPEQVSRTRTIADLVEEVGSIRSQTRLLGDDVAETGRRARIAYQEMVERQLDVRARRLAKVGMLHLLGELADRGFAWRDIAALAGVSVPAVRRWRQGETPTGDNLLRVARVVALVETLREDHLVSDVASWMEMPLAQGAPLTALDLAVAGRLPDVVDVAAGHSTGESVLDLWRPGWRAEFHSEFEVFEAPDGEPGIRPVDADDA